MVDPFARCACGHHLFQHRDEHYADLPFARCVGAVNEREIEIGGIRYVVFEHCGCGHFDLVEAERGPEGGGLHPATRAPR